MPIIKNPSVPISILNPTDGLLSPLTEDEEYLSIQSEDEIVNVEHPIPQEANGQQQCTEQQSSNGSSAINLGSKPKTRQSVSKRCGLVFPVSRVHRKLRVAMLKKRIGPAPAIYLAAVLEYLVAELVELSGDVS
jgi:hypothetical protein